MFTVNFWKDENKEKEDVTFLKRRFTWAQCDQMLEIKEAQFSPNLHKRSQIQFFA